MTTSLTRRVLSYPFLSLLIVVFFPAIILAGKADFSLNEECAIDLIHNGSPDMTITEVKRQCNNLDESSDRITKSPVEKRVAMDKSNIGKPFTIMAHRQNYILLAANNFKGWKSNSFDLFVDEETTQLDNTEVQFQLSVKIPLAVELFDEKIDIFGAYTVRSFWQAYNSDISSPFRETNHEPQLWIQYRPEIYFGKLKNSINSIGIDHQSNGQAGEISRSWDRIYAAFGFEIGNFAFLVKPWYRIPENVESDDNPDITDFMGHASLEMAYKHGRHTFTVMSRNNLESGFSRGAIQLGWSFPLFQYDFIKGYVQYFSGYGESLIDYDHYVNRIGFGLLLTDLL